MRFVVLRYGGAVSGPAGPAALLDPFAADGPRVPRPPAGTVPGGGAADGASTQATPTGRARPTSDDADPEDVALAAALARVVDPPHSLRDDLAALAAVLGVRTVLDESLGSPDVATTVRSRLEGLTLTDGAATGTDGPLVGLHVLDAPDLDALVDVLTLLPAGTFEVHPVVAA